MTADCHSVLTLEGPRLDADQVRARQAHTHADTAARGYQVLLHHHVNPRCAGSLLMTPLACFLYSLRFA
jgi:hypothetical protein